MIALALLFAACAPRIAAVFPDDSGASDGGTEDGGSADGGTQDGGTDDGGTQDGGSGDDYSEYDGATLEIISPVSGGFYPLGEGVPFEARVLAADGSELDFDDIDWVTSVDSSWAETGALFESELTVGTHTITAVAELPNGDRLGWTVAGILVQHPDAGTYVGDLSVDFTITYKKVPYTTTCIGAATMVVDAWGETALGDSACTTSLLGYDLDSVYAFELGIVDQEVEGDAILDLTWFESQFPATGSVGDGELTLTWADDLLGFVEFAGELNLTRISLETGE